MIESIIRPFILLRGPATSLCARRPWDTIQGMKRTRIGIIHAAALAALLVSACSTVPPAQNGRRVARLVEELNTADEDRVMKLSALPFLLDGETVAREEDLRTLWRNLRSTGFTFADAKIEEIRAIGPDSYKAFADDPETLACFKKHTGKGAATVRLRTGRGVFTLLTGGRSGFLPKIYGFTGPEGD